MHEIVAGLIPSLAPSPNDTREHVERVTIARLERKPTPTPSPTPPPPHAIALSNLNVTPARQPVTVPAPAGRAAHRETIKHMGAPRPKPPRFTHAKPIWDMVPTTGGQGAGAGKGTDAGSLGEGTNGTGTGTSGSGAGGGGAPCGAVDFSAQGSATFNAQSGFYERNNVRATVHYADGTAETITLDWTWRFRSEDLDPFSPSSNVPMFFQFPPAGQRASEPAVVQYIMKNSKSYGATLLNDKCPNIPPPPSPHP